MGCPAATKLGDLHRFCGPQPRTATSESADAILATGPRSVHSFADALDDLPWHVDFLGVGNVDHQPFQLDRLSRVNEEVLVDGQFGGFVAKTIMAATPDSQPAFLDLLGQLALAEFLLPLIDQGPIYGTGAEVGHMLIAAQSLKRALEKRAIVAECRTVTR